MERGTVEGASAKQIDKARRWRPTKIPLLTAGPLCPSGARILNPLEEINMDGPFGEWSPSRSVVMANEMMVGLGKERGLFPAEIRALREDKRHETLATKIQADKNDTYVCTEYVYRITLENAFASVLGTLQHQEKPPRVKRLDSQFYNTPSRNEAPPRTVGLTRNEILATEVLGAVGCPLRVAVWGRDKTLRLLFRFRQSFLTASSPKSSNFSFCSIDEYKNDRPSLLRGWFANTQRSTRTCIGVMSGTSKWSFDSQKCPFSTRRITQKSSCHKPPRRCQRYQRYCNHLRVTPCYQIHV